MRLLTWIWLVFLAAFPACSGKARDASVVAYLGGSGTDDCDGIAVDSGGNIYLACHSDSPDFSAPARSSAYGSGGGMDALVVKIDGRTGHLLWVTRIGGSSWDAVGDLVVTSSGSIFVIGSTRSSNFPTTPDAVQRKFGGPDRDAILLELDAAGKVIYSTLIGGSKNDESTSLAVADDGYVYVAGGTMSSDFPGARVAAFGHLGKTDGFIARLRPGDPGSLQTVLIGGTGRTDIRSLALDRAGNIFATGYTNAPDFPLKLPLQPNFGGAMDAFVLKLHISDWNLLFSTYLGGKGMEAAYSMALDASGNPIISGVTESADFPVTQSVFQTKLRGTVDAFITKLDALGHGILWSTFYGGTGLNSDQGEAGSVAIDQSGRIWLDGMTNAIDMPTRLAYQSSFQGGEFDGFVMSLSPDGSTLCYGSYIGGMGHDILEGIATRGDQVYVSGITASHNLKQTPTHVQVDYGGGPYDAFFASLEGPDDLSCSKPGR